MNLNNKTALITGGGSGIGFEIARLLSENGNKVIIVGRDEERLKKAAAKLNGVDYFAADITDRNSVESLMDFVGDSNPKLDILVNNAGQMFTYDLDADAGMYEKATAEISSNYLSVVNLTSRLLPLLKSRNEAAIVNVSSILALSPVSMVATYSSSKAALHSFSQSLRLSLSKSTSVKVFELMPSLVNTDFSKDIGGETGIHPAEVAAGLLEGMENDTYEIHIGQTEQFYDNFFSLSEAAFKRINEN